MQVAFTWNEKAVQFHLSCKVLWDALLELSITDAHGLPRNAPYKGAKTQAINSARRWFRDESCHVGSFRYVCEVLDRDPKTVRDMALRPEKMADKTRGLELAPLVLLFRQKHKLNQKAFASKVGLTGPCICNIERGLFNTRKATELKIRVYIARAEARS